MNPKEMQAHIDRVFADQVKAYERSRGLGGFARELGKFIAGGVVFVGAVAGFTVFFMHLHPH